MLTRAWPRADAVSRLAVLRAASAARGLGAQRVGTRRPACVRVWFDHGVREEGSHVVLGVLLKPSGSSPGPGVFAMGPRRCYFWLAGIACLLTAPGKTSALLSSFKRPHLEEDGLSFYRAPYCQWWSS